MSNNEILRKLRIAHQLKDEDIIMIFSLVNFDISKSQLGNYFRKSDHPFYKECEDHVLRKFLDGLIIHLRGPLEPRKS